MLISVPIYLLQYPDPNLVHFQEPQGEEGDGDGTVDNVQEKEEEEEEDLEFDEDGKERKKRGKKIAGAERGKLRTF